MLQKEYAYYQSHKKELNEKYPAKFIGIVGEEVVGVYASELEAYEKLKSNYAVGTFLIQECLPGSNHIQRYHSRVAFT